MKVPKDGVLQVGEEDPFYLSLFILMSGIIIRLLKSVGLDIQEIKQPQE
jgi:hypothetical protein